MKMKKIFQLCVFIICFFFAGFIIGKITYDNNPKGELDYILNIEQWNVNKFFINDQLVYESNGKSYIDDNQEEGWNLLLEQISLVGYKRNKTEGSAAHIKYKIEMKNGDVYYIEHLGCLHQVDITYPNGKTIKYYAYN